jgi:hypothetical protein
MCMPLAAGPGDTVPTADPEKCCSCSVVVLNAYHCFHAVCFPCSVDVWLFVCCGCLAVCAFVMRVMILIRLRCLDVTISRCALWFPLLNPD